VAHASDAGFLVLHTLRLRGFAEADVLADRTGLTPDEVLKHLAVFEADGLVKHRAGRVSGWTLTAAGRTEDEAQASAELDETGARAAIEDAYGLFLSHNADVLQVCTDWQIRETAHGHVVNDHDDTSYDTGVVDRLVEIDRMMQPVASRLASALDRFDGYGSRLATAVERVRCGEKDWFTKPLIDSYHTVWFELHEDLLATLGIERGKETS
jgi:hypothetical protein